MTKRERGSNAKNTMLENEAWTKGWSDQRENRKILKNICLILIG